MKPFHIRYKRFVISDARNYKLFKSHLFSNAVKLMLSISDAQYYVPLKLCRTAGSTHLLKIAGNLIPGHLKLRTNVLSDILELD